MIERASRKEEEQQHALKGLNGRRGQAQHELRQLAPDIGQCHQQTGQQDADGVQPAKEGHDDRGEPVAGRDRPNAAPTPS